MAEDDALSIPGILTVENNLRVSFPEEYTVLSDSEIIDSINDILLWDSRIDSSKIDVDADEGIVTLEGSVDAFWKRSVAENIANSVSGVISVINNLNVVLSGRYEDEKIAEDVKNALRRSALVNSEDIIVVVSGGVITLRGEVSDLIAKRTAFDRAAYTEGVVSIDNQITII